MLFAIFFAFWRFVEIITLVSSHMSLISYLFAPGLRVCCRQAPADTRISCPTDSSAWHAQLLCQRLQLKQPPDAHLHPDPVHRLCAWRGVGHLHAVQLPPQQLQRALRRAG